MSNNIEIKKGPWIGNVRSSMTVAPGSADMREQVEGSAGTEEVETVTKENSSEEAA